MPSFGRVHDHRGEDARCDAAEQSVADLLDHHAQRMRLAAGAGDGRQRDQQQGNADPVVEAALDVERLTHNLRKPRVRDDRAAKPGVGRREDHPQDQRLAERERPKQKHRDQPTEHDRQGQTHAKQTHRHRSLAPQRPQIHPRGIREQHHRERRLGQRPHSRTRGTHRKVIKHQRPHQHADRGHHHRRRDRRARQTPRHRRHEQQRKTDNRKPGIHRSSFSAEVASRDMLFHTKPRGVPGLTGQARESTSSGSPAENRSPLKATIRCPAWRPSNPTMRPAEPRQRHGLNDCDRAVTLSVLGCRVLTMLGDLLAHLASRQAFRHRDAPLSVDDDLTR